MIDDIAYSTRRVAGFNDAERLLLWALRHCVAEQDPDSPHLINAFTILCGPAEAPTARAALTDLVAALDTHARWPLVFLEWCQRTVTADEAAVLDCCAALQAGGSARQLIEGVVFTEGVEHVHDAAEQLVTSFRVAGLLLPWRHQHVQSWGTRDAGHPAPTLH
ncbi:MAG: hypothetical protein AAFX81_14435 [Pseudomonadota bacterium]